MILYNMIIPELSDDVNNSGILMLNEILFLPLIEFNIQCMYVFNSVYLKIVVISKVKHLKICRLLKITRY